MSEFFFNQNQKTNGEFMLFDFLILITILILSFDFYNGSNFH